MIDSTLTAIGNLVDKFRPDPAVALERAKKRAQRQAARDERRLLKLQIKAAKEARKQ